VGREEPPEQLQFLPPVWAKMCLLVLCAKFLVLNPVTQKLYINFDVFHDCHNYPLLSPKSTQRVELQTTEWSGKNA